MSTVAAHLPPALPGRASWGTAGALRAWQQTALDAYAAAAPRDFLAVATPGAGKTTFALRVAADLLARRVVEAVTVVAPTEHLKRQWAQAAHQAGIALDPEFSNGQGALAPDFTGVVVTYAQVAAHPLLHRRRTELRRTLVVLDEVHHAGDALTWGEAVEEAFDPAVRRLAMTGTPFRSDVNPIPFVHYAPGEDGVPRSVADHRYGYAEALRDGVVRPVIFLAYTGQMRWRTRAGDEIAASLGEPMTKDLTAQAWRTALDPLGAWVPSVLAAADRRLTEVRRHVGDAGGLVIASDQASARAYAAQLAAVSGQQPTLVLSDEPGSSARIEAFARSTDRWLVAVRMVSEGVDIPRLSVGVYATSTSTPLFFAQAVGRFVRGRRRGETASIFLPSIPSLLEHAAALEAERDHVLGRSDDGENLWSAEDALVAEAQRAARDGIEDDQLAFEALESEATFDRVLFDGGEFGTHAAAGSAEEEEFLGIPGLLEPHQVVTVLRARQAEQVAARGRRRVTAEEPAPTTAEAVRALRKELNGLVGAWHHRTGRPHATIHAELVRACAGPPAALADAATLQCRVVTIRTWAVGRA
ncbi:MAG TPA: DEAD/DEAH box helicase [Candidatus Limnocylindria bacterium]|nr:DEAD/DEAH box helicase [Candidatus Limnocylindria bacterium]